MIGDVEKGYRKVLAVTTQLQPVNVQPVNKQTKASKPCIHSNCGISSQRKAQRLEVYRQKDQADVIRVIIFSYLKTMALVQRQEEEFPGQHIAVREGTFLVPTSFPEVPLLVTVEDKILGKQEGGKLQ